MASSNQFRKFCRKGIKTFGSAAAGIASSTRHKVGEVTLLARRKDVLADLAGNVYSLWLKGEKLPGQLTEMLEELQRIDRAIADMKAAKAEQGTPGAGKPEKELTALPEHPTATEDESTPKDATEDSEPKTEAKTEEPEEPETPKKADLAASLSELPPSPVENEINEYFDGMSSVGKMAEKVNTTLEQMSERIRSFPAKGGDAQAENHREEAL